MSVNLPRLGHSSCLFPSDLQTRIFYGFLTAPMRAADPTYLIFFFIGIVVGGVQLGPLGIAATNRPIVPAPGDYGRNWWNDWQGKQKYSKKTCPNAALSTTNPTCCPDANPDRRGGKPVTNRLSYGTAVPTYLTFT
jgi:hypothetical protein